MIVLPIWMLAGQEAPGVERVIQPKLARAADVEIVIRPKLTLPEIKDAERKEVDLWIIDEFRCIPVRMITVEVPGQGKRLLWYLVFRATNEGTKPRPFVPNFTFVDDKGTQHLDTIIPKAQLAIQNRHNPLQPLENSITAIRRGLDKDNPADWLLPGTEEGVESGNSVTGVAIWDGSDATQNSFESRRRAAALPSGDGINPKLNSFDILIRGLSNGFKLIEDPATGEVVKRQYKTLRLRFARPGDQFNQNEREIRYLDHEWLYQ